MRWHRAPGVARRGFGIGRWVKMKDHIPFGWIVPFDGEAGILQVFHPCDLIHLVDALPVVETM